MKRGEGKVLKLDGQRVACYRDEEGKVSTVSAVCTHMGCLVHWNRRRRPGTAPVTARDFTRRAK